MLLLPILAFICASLLVAAAAMALSPSTATIEQRLGEIVGVPHKTAAASRFATAFVDTFTRIGQRRRNRRPKWGSCAANSCPPATGQKKR